VATFGKQNGALKPTSSRLAAARFACAITSVTLALWANTAFASQGPGGGQGTASNLTQLTMAVIVYGGSVLLVGAGLIGAARRR
jgi:hypothetical protein